MAIVMKGKPVADAISEKLTTEVVELKSKGISPKLTIIRVGAKGSDLAYERGALKRCESIGILTQVVELPEDITEENFVKEIEKANKDKETHGILVFRPLPAQIGENVPRVAVDPAKDVDCMSPINFGKVFEGNTSGFGPCTAEAVVELLKHYEVAIKGTDVTVVGASPVIGKPVSMMLLNEFATVSTCHIFTKNTAAISSQSDVVVSACGVAKLIKAGHLKEGAIVVDVGINVLPDGTMCGDVAYDEVFDKVKAITPVPGGIGAITTSILASHVVKACKLQNNL